MTNEIIPFDFTGAGPAQLPAHLANVFGTESNIAPRQQIDQLSYRGKTWRRVVKGEETVITRPSPDNPGEQEPVSIISVIVLDQNKQRSRSFFEGNYEEGSNKKPRCYSSDGVTPDSSVKDPISPTCASCPNAVKGSKITENNKQTTLCSPFKRLCVAPSSNIGQHVPMLLKLAQTSIWDGQNQAEEAKGWYAWDNYQDMLRARGAKHTAMVETRIKFDSAVAYPKLLFNAVRWLSPEEAVAARQFMEKSAEAIETIINGAGDTDGVMGQTAGAVGSAGTNSDNSHTAAAAGPAVDKPAATPAPTQAPAPAATKAPATPKKPPAAPKPPAPQMKVTKKIDLEKTGGFTLEQMIEAGWTEDALIAEGMLLVVEEPVTPPKPPAAPKKPPTPPKPPAAPAPAPADDGGFGAAPPPAAAAPQQAAAPSTDVPAGLKGLLDEWDDSSES